jgi:hypothetical protein
LRHAEIILQIGELKSVREVCAHMCGGVRAHVRESDSCARYRKRDTRTIDRIDQSSSARLQSSSIAAFFFIRYSLFVIRYSHRNAVTRTTRVPW